MRSSAVAAFVFKVLLLHLNCCCFVLQKDALAKRLEDLEKRRNRAKRRNCIGCSEEFQPDKDEAELDPLVDAVCDKCLQAMHTPDERIVCKACKRKIAYQAAHNCKDNKRKRVSFKENRGGMVGQSLTVVR